MPKPKPKAKPSERHAKTEPQKRGEVFDTLLTFFRRKESQTLTLEFPRALKSYPYIAMKRAGVKAKAEYETISKAADPLDDVLRFTVTLPEKKTHEKKRKQKTVAKSKPEKERKAEGDKQAKATGDSSNRLGRGTQRVRKSSQADIVPIAPTKGVDLTQLAVANA